MQKQQDASNLLKIYPQTASQEIRESIKVLKLAFRLQAGFRKNLIDKECFTNEVGIDVATGTRIKSGTFDKQELEPQFHNLVLSALATVYITVDNSLDKTFGDRDPNQTDNIGSLRAFFYMLRCAVAHDIMNPRWAAKDKYQNVYTVVVPKKIMMKITQDETALERKFTFDFVKLNGNEVILGDFGAIGGLVPLALYAASLTQKVQDL